MKNRIKQMKKLGISIDVEKDNLTNEQKFNDKVLRIFQKIDELNAQSGRNRY